MPRPTNKIELLSAARKEYAALEKFLAPISLEQQRFAPAPDSWAMKDILTHLYEWQQMFFAWHETGKRGETPCVPAQGYKWSQLPALNQFIYEKHRDLPLDKVWELFRESHQQTLKLIEELPDVDLVTPGLYGWMNQNTLLAYLHANTDAHYTWALKECKKLMKGMSA